jgi:hypothetical protein
MTDMFSGLGPSEHDANQLTMPAFVETEPGVHKALEECTRAEIEAQIMALIMQGQAMLDEAKTLYQYVDSREQ